MAKTFWKPIVDVIRARQRARFERDGTLNGGSTLNEIADELNVTPLTIRRHLPEVQRLWALRERLRPQTNRLTGAPLSGRPSIEYYVEGGHLWDEDRRGETLVAAGSPGKPAAGARSAARCPCCHRPLDGQWSVDDASVMTDDGQTAICNDSDNRGALSHR